MLATFTGDNPVHEQKTTPPADPVSECRALIIGADDFGASESVNAAILAAHDAGVLTSCSLMVVGDAAATAVAAARERPALGVGLHLVLVCGRAMLPAGKLPRLVDVAGRFPGSPLRAGVRLAFDPAARRELRAEIEAQFAAFAATGLPMSHVDGHLHFHLHPVIFEIAMELAERHGCRRVRLPRDDFRRHLAAVGPRAWASAPLAGIFALLLRRAGRRLQGRGFHWPGRVYGLLQTGRIDEEFVLRLVRALPPGVSELYLHPDTAPGPTGNGPAELAALRSPRVRAALRAERVRLLNYHELESALCP
jgi:hopanoid biosynthesis associated protein HpnK